MFLASAILVVTLSGCLGSEPEAASPTPTGEDVRGPRYNRGSQPGPLNTTAGPTVLTLDRCSLVSRAVPWPMAVNIVPEPFQVRPMDPSGQFGETLFAVLDCQDEASARMTFGIIMVRVEPFPAAASNRVSEYFFVQEVYGPASVLREHFAAAGAERDSGVLWVTFGDLGENPGAQSTVQYESTTADYTSTAVMAGPPVESLARGLGFYTIDEPGIVRLTEMGISQATVYDVGMAMVQFALGGPRPDPAFHWVEFHATVEFDVASANVP